MNDAWNHFYLVVCLFAIWTITLAFPLRGKEILWDFEKYPEDEKK